MLDKELDKLRDKTLSFWCLLNVSFYDNEEHKYLWKYISCFLNSNRFAVVDELIDYKNSLYWLWPFTKEDEWIEIIWHPINWWRLYILRHWIKPSYLELWEPQYDHAKYNEFYLCFEDIKDLMYHIWFDKSEIERMQNEYWEDLKKLLIQFSNYL